MTAVAGYEAVNKSYQAETFTSILANDRITEDGLVCLESKAEKIERLEQKVLSLQMEVYTLKTEKEQYLKHGRFTLPFYSNKRSPSNKGPFTNTCKGGPDAKKFQREKFSGPPFWTSKFFGPPLFAKENKRQPHRKSYRPNFQGQN